MRLARLIAPAAFCCAAASCWLGAGWAVSTIEDRSTGAVEGALHAAGEDWAAVASDGLQVRLTGTATSEAERFRALTVAGTAVDAARVIDAMTVAVADAAVAPRFSVELLRNEDGISLIGLVPASKGRAAITDRLAGVAGEVTDMLETADHPVPDGWTRALGFGLDAAKLLPRSKISIAAGEVSVTAISGSLGEKRRIESDLARAAPKGVSLALDITAPRPVITPFTLRFVREGATGRFDACSATTPEERDAILRAGVAAGTEGKATCTIGLGAPAPTWSDAAAKGIAALATLGDGSVTISDADISLIAAASVPQSDFDRVTGDLEAELPDAFSLTAVRAEAPDVTPTATDLGPPEFTAERAPDGTVTLRGRLPDARFRDAVTSYARATFGSDAVYPGARLDPGLPEGWPLRVLAGLGALGELHHGSLEVGADLIDVRGVSGNPAGGAEIARLLSSKLGSGKEYRIAVSYDKAFDPDAALPTPEECVTAANAALDAEKIAFEPGSALIDASANATLDRLATGLKTCTGVEMEIGGHTDAQGRDEMNRDLSQSRAEAVLEALMARRVPVSNLTAKGYGETEPIADNDTEEGREANRRIAFRLLGQPEADDASPAVVAEPDAAPDAAPDVTADAVTPAVAAEDVPEAGGEDLEGGTVENDVPTADEAAPAPDVVVEAPAPDQLRPAPRPDRT